MSPFFQEKPLSELSVFRVFFAPFSRHFWSLNCEVLLADKTELSSLIPYTPI